MNEIAADELRGMEMTKSKRKEMEVEFRNHSATAMTSAAKQIEKG